MQRNRLAAETSPYLLQHADNPVDWYSWGAEALELAQRTDKPILLSVGYSACHWCHVMAHESFEDPDTAAVMNRLFVNIKVDREERPDLDKIYQAAQQMITQQAGGWPLTMFLNPSDQRPFFGGTYFPNEPRHGMPAFKQILERVAEYYRTHSAEIRRQSTQLEAAFARMLPDAVDDAQILHGPPPDASPPDASPLALARAALAESFDSRFGGFGGAPKFPNPGSIERCLRDDTPEALSMATLTLTRMAEGGIYDQLGGGFARYSVDEAWMIPHFEKMLYDNGQLLGSYADAALKTGNKLFARIADGTANWMLRDMRAPEGGFYSSLDADSEGHEGKFYVWNRAELQDLLTQPEYRVFAQRFGLDEAANFEGAWHLYVRDSRAQDPLIDAARAKLLAVRNLRVWPARDEKILTAWNALTIKGLAIAARALHRPDLADAAVAAVDFIHGTLWRDGRLLATCKDGRAHLAAYLDDYAFLVDALIELLQTRWRSRDLEFAQALAEVMLAQFEDRDGGGFFFTAADHERLIHRSKTFGDESIPAGNGIAAAALTRLGHLLGEVRYLRAAERTLKAAWIWMRDYPQAHLSMVNALEDALEPISIVIIRGSVPAITHWAKTIGAHYAPMRMIFAIPADTPDLPPALAEKTGAGQPAAGEPGAGQPGAGQPAGGDAADGAVAYICTGTTCSAPVTGLDELKRALSVP